MTAAATSLNCNVESSWYKYIYIYITCPDSARQRISNRQLASMDAQKLFSCEGVGFHGSNMLQPRKSTLGADSWSLITKSGRVLWPEVFILHPVSSAVWWKRFQREVFAMSLPSTKRCMMWTVQIWWLRSGATRATSVVPCLGAMQSQTLKWRDSLAQMHP